MRVSLREVVDDDLETFWEMLTDPVSHQVSAFTRPYHYDRGAFDEFWARIRSDPTTTQWTVVADGEVAGYVGVFGPPDEREVTYTLGRAHWGQGIATAALAALIELEPRRPLHGAAAADNVASRRVLAKCGFREVGTEREFARARNEEIDVVLMVLD